MAQGDGNISAIQEVLTRHLVPLGDRVAKNYSNVVEVRL